MNGGTLVREARERAGLTQAGLAARAGTTQSSIARLENGAEPSLPRLEALLGACGVAMQVRLVRTGKGNGIDPGVPASGHGTASRQGSGPAEIVRRLDAADVPFVLAGRAAAAVHGVPVDDGVPLVVPDLAATALERLASALDDLHARRRVDDEGATLPFERTASGLRARSRWQLATIAGELDLDFEPPGTRGFVDLVRRASVHDGILVASPADAARHLDAAADDLAVVAQLRALAAAGG